MDIFENVKSNISMRSVAEAYGVKVNRHNRGLCPFHDDRHPSMLVAEDHYHCFACGAHGDVINFVAELTGLRPYEAAKQLAAQYGLQEGILPSPEIQLKKRKLAEAQQLRNRERLCFLVLSDFRWLLIRWKDRYAPEDPDEEWDEHFAEACQKLDQTEYQLDLLLEGTQEEKALLMDELLRSGKLAELQESLKQEKMEDDYGKEESIAG